MPALLLSVPSSSAPLPCQCSLPVVSSWRFLDSNSSSSGAPLKVFSCAVKNGFFTALSSSSRHIFPQARALNHSLSVLLALGLCTIEVLSPLQPASAEACNRWPDQDRTSRPQMQCAASAPLSPNAAPHLLFLNLHSAQESPNVVETSWADVTEEACLSPSIETPSTADDSILFYQNSLSANRKYASSSHLFEISSSEAEQPKPFLDYARVFGPAKTASLLNDIDTLEAEAGWRLRVITKSGSAPSISGKDLKDLWKPDDKTVIVIEELSSPNILNINAGADVLAKLPRQFFLELQSRYGNQFFVQQEGEGEALALTVQAIGECLRQPEGCKNVPGLTDDLYYLTLATSIVGGCVFGFAARLSPSGRVDASWQWVIFLSPLWLLLFGAFGILPVVGRTSELEPLLKNVLGFSAGAFALYLTPIFGSSPISKK